MNLLRIAVGAIAGIIAGVVAGAVSGGISVGLVFGVSCGVAGGFVLGEHRAWWGYLVVTLKLARSGRSPRQLMLFLDDAHRLGLLRAVGPIYQFRHAEFQDHLAATYNQDSH